MFYVTNVFALPFVILVSIFDLTLVLLGLRFIAGLLPAHYHRTAHATLVRLTDPIVHAVNRRFLLAGGTAFQRNLTWGFLIVMAMAIRHVLVEVIIVIS